MRTERRWFRVASQRDLSEGAFEYEYDDARAKGESGCYHRRHQWQRVGHWSQIRRVRLHYWSSQGRSGSAVAQIGKDGCTRRRRKPRGSQPVVQRSEEAEPEDRRSVCRSGVAKRAPFGTVTEEFFDIHFNANVRGLFFTVRSRTKNEHRSYRAAHPTNQQLLILALDGP